MKPRSIKKQREAYLFGTVQREETIRYTRGCVTARAEWRHRDVLRR